MVMSARRPPWPPGGRELFARQLGIARRDQLRALGLNSDAVDGQVRAGRWITAGPVVVCMENGRLDVQQLRWIAVLHHGPSAALCAWTALQARGLEGFERPDIHVVVPRGVGTVPPPQLPTVRVAGAAHDRLGRGVAGLMHPRVVLHQSRRHGNADIEPPDRGTPPCHGAARAAVDCAAWGPSGRAAAAVLAAVVQRRLAHPEALQEQLAKAGAVRRRRLMAAVLQDVQGGAHALSELDFARLCRGAGLSEPLRQAVRTDSSGRRRFLDAEWVRPDGRLVVVEVDGRGHMDQQVWEGDLLRANDVVIQDDAIVLRFPATVLRTEPQLVIAQLRRALTP